MCQGYLNQPELNNKYFLDYDPFDDTAADLDYQNTINNNCQHHHRYRLYKTRDLVYRTDDGDIKFVGRMDDQIKLNGFRVELQEICTVLNRLTERSHVLMIDQRIVAYYIHRSSSAPRTDTQGVKVSNAEAKTQGVDTKPTIVDHSIDNSSMSKQLKQECERLLPSYAVPKVFIPLTELPTNINGKIDRNVLISLYYDLKSKHELLVLS